MKYHDWCYWECCKASICLKHNKECKPRGLKEWVERLYWLWLDVVEWRLPQPVLRLINKYRSQKKGTK